MRPRRQLPHRDRIEEDPVAHEPGHHERLAQEREEEIAAAEGDAAEPGEEEEERGQPERRGPRDERHPEGKPVGVARWISGSDGPPELSVTVIDEYQGKGVGSRLMDALLALARKRGVTRIIAEVLRENTGMRALVNRYRAVVQRSDDPVVVRYRIDV